jgi:hypothetical protein
MRLSMFALAIIYSAVVAAQNPAVSPAINFTKEELRNHLLYIASDELAGRRTASRGSDMAAEYIALQFGRAGVQIVPGQDSWYQRIPFNAVKPPMAASLKIGEKTFTLGENLVVMSGGKLKMETDAVFVKHGWIDPEKGIDDYKDLDVKGKIVFALPGSSESANPMELFNSMTRKRQIAISKGAAGMVELFRVNFPWRFFKGYFERQRLEIVENESGNEGDFFHAWLLEGMPNPVIGIEKGEDVTVEIDNAGLISERLYSSNVVGYIPGTDADLKKEHIILSAHYDHVGVGREGGMGYTAEDSIFNGARDNGLGTVALIAAAKSLAASPLKRSVLLIALTGEEMGLLGSNYYTKHPWLPLEKAAYNLNTDGAGYNSTGHISVIGWGRTNADNYLQTAAEEFNLEVIQNPAPGQNLYDRSDNASFARAGIPAVNFAPGLTDFDDEINKYYHKAVDNPNTVDFDYLFKLSSAFSAAARKIGNAAELKWMPGDVYDKKKTKE